MNLANTALPILASNYQYYNSKQIWSISMSVRNRRPACDPGEANILHPKCRHHIYNESNVVILVSTDALTLK